MAVIDSQIKDSDTPYDWGTEVWRTGDINFFGTVAGYFKLASTGKVFCVIEGMSGNIHCVEANSPDLKRTKKQLELCPSRA